MDYVENNPSTLPSASGFMGGLDSCPMCLDATEILLEKCTEQSIALAITSQDAMFGKDGKIVLTEEHYGELSKFYYDGKINLTRTRKTRRRIGGRVMYHTAIKDDVVRRHFEGEDTCGVPNEKMWAKKAEQFLSRIDTDFFQQFMFGTTAANSGCKECAGIFDDIGTDRAPYVIRIPKGANAGTTAFETAATQFLQFIINVTAALDNTNGDCDGEKYIAINKCYAPLMAYIENAGSAICGDTCNLISSLMPMTVSGGSLPHIYFSKKVPVSIVNGIQTSAVLAGFYKDDIIKPEPVFVRNGLESAENTAVFDQVFYAYQYANVRPDRKVKGMLSIKMEA